MNQNAALHKSTNEDIQGSVLVGQVKDKIRSKKYPQKIDIEKLIAEHGDFVFRFIKKRNWDTQSCEDVYQSTLLEAIKSAKKFRGDSHPRTWLCGIAFNMIRNNAKNLNETTIDSLNDYQNIENVTQNEGYGSEDPLSIYSRDKMLNAIFKTYTELPNEMRITFNEVVSEGKSYDEAAKELNLPIGTVRSRIARARGIFRENSRAA